MSPEASTSERSTSGALRPRIRRTPGGSAPLSNDVGGIRSPSHPALGSLSPSYRHPSPVPAPHPSLGDTPASTYSSRSRSDSRPKALAQPSSTGIWSPSWSTLRDTASTIWNGDYLRPPESLPAQRRKQREPWYGDRSRRKSQQWGPPSKADRHIGGGTAEDRIAQVQAKKREVLLSANAKLDQGNNVGKRRNSNECSTTSAPPDLYKDRDSLVYLHQVQPNDTMAGVMIKYACPQAVFRKANRLWPNDRIQIRKNVYLPVDACGVRGRKLSQKADNATELDLLGFEESDSHQTPTNHTAPWNHQNTITLPTGTPLSSGPTSPSISVSLAETSRSSPEPWTHDSWVQIDGFDSPVEIARLSRRTLGYFPPSRRKSNSFSDVDSRSTSLDLGRNSDRPVASPLIQRTRGRGQSRSSSGSYFVERLQGVGGVGTLGRDVHSPGPAQDGLNKMFAAHLPDVAPKGSLEDLQWQNGQSTGLENIGGAVEGWVRKLAKRAGKGVHANANRSGSRNRGVGDLIEMDDTSDFGSDDGRSRMQSRDGRAKAAEGSRWMDTVEEPGDPFAPRGRVFEDASKR